ncbi:hypothetical protein ACP275_02G070800 [Erythranthe tilingii]
MKTPTGGETAAPSTEEETVAAAKGGMLPASAAAFAEEERKRALIGKPPADDVCPICFGVFEVPCKTAPCGHWYCGKCILQLWNFSYASQQCKCPMCSQRITKLIPEASLYDMREMREVETRKVLKSVDEYNNLYVGGFSGFMLMMYNLKHPLVGNTRTVTLTYKLRIAIPLYISRRCREVLNGERQLALLNDLRILAMILGAVYSIIPFDFLRIGERNIHFLFDRSAFVAYLIVSLAAIYLHGRRQRHVREMVDLEAQND